MTPEHRKHFGHKEGGERDDREGRNPKGKSPHRGKPWENKRQFPDNRSASDQRRNEGKQGFRNDFNRRGGDFRSKPPGDRDNRENRSDRPDRDRKWGSRQTGQGGNRFGRGGRPPHTGGRYEKKSKPWEERKPRKPFGEKRPPHWSEPRRVDRSDDRVGQRPDAAALQPVITGRKPVLEALRAGTQIERIVILHGTHGGIIEGIESAAREKHIRLQEVDKDQFQQIAGDEHAQGVAAIIGKRKQATLEEIIARGKAKNEKGLILLLDEIEDPHNLGALIRTAECSGFHGVVVPRHHAAPITNTVVKTSAGATEHLPIAEETNLVQVIGDLKKEGFWVVGLDMEGTTNYTETDFSSPTALVVGSERKGIRRLVREHCDVLVKIPLHGNIDSLNASVAGALVMFEARKSRAVS